MKNRSEVVATRPLSDRERENVLSLIGTLLFSSGFEPQVHTRDALGYRRVVKMKSGFPLLRNPRVEYERAVVQVTDLTVTFSPEGMAPIDVVAGHAFGVSAPPQVKAEIDRLLEPFVEDVDILRANAGRALVGKEFRYRLPQVACDFCGRRQDVYIPVKIESMEGATGHGPGGCIQVKCSEASCGKTFEVSWDNMIIKVEAD